MQINRYITSLLLAGSILGAAATVGCGGGVAIGYRAHDPYHNDYHRWDDNEVRYYSQWNVETRRPSGRAYKQLKRDEQREYWNWRHDHK